MPEVIVVVYKPLHTVVLIKAVRYICIETFVHKTSILFELYGHVLLLYCIATGYFCCLHKKNLGGPTYNEYLSSCKISSSVLLRF